MEDISKKLTSFLQEYFGVLAESFISREIKKLGFKSVNRTDDQQKKLLADKIVENVFLQIFSPNKCSTIRSRLYSIMNLSSESKKSLNKMAEIDYLRSRD